MASVRISQIGQLGVNRPFFEVLVDNKRYMAYVDSGNRVLMGNAKMLQSLGVNSLVAKQFYNVDQDVRKALGLVGDSTVVDQRFKSLQTLGSGFALVADFTRSKGWRGLNPSTSFVLQTPN